MYHRRSSVIVFGFRPLAGLSVLETRFLLSPPYLRPVSPENPILLWSRLPFCLALP